MTKETKAPRKPRAKKVPTTQQEPITTELIMVEPTIVVTNIYSENIIEGVDQCKMMLASFREHGYEVANISQKSPVRGNGNVLRELYNCYKRAKTGHDFFVYSDGADTFCQRKFTVPTNKILYSAETNCYPLPELMAQYPETESPWRYLNGGGYGGPLELMIEFIEKYGLHKLPAEANGQLEQSKAFLQAIKDGFPIELDVNCTLFQTTAFTNAEQFSIKGEQIYNKVTGSWPAIFHANGRSPMRWIYDVFK